MEMMQESVMFPLKQKSADLVTVPMYLLDYYESFSLHIRKRMLEANQPQQSEQSLYIVCWLRPLIADDTERERIVQFLIVTETHKQIYQSTPQYKLCQGCNGRLPLGRDRLGRERDCEYF